MPKKFESDQEAVFSMAFLTKVTNITILNFLLCQHDQHGPRILIIMTSTQINQKKMRRLEKEYTTMKSKEKEVRLRNMPAPPPANHHNQTKQIFE